MQRFSCNQVVSTVPGCQSCAPQAPSIHTIHPTPPPPPPRHRLHIAQVSGPPPTWLCSVAAPASSNDRTAAASSRTPSRRDCRWRLRAVAAASWRQTSATSARHPMTALLRPLDPAAMRCRSRNSSALTRGGGRGARAAHSGRARSEGPRQHRLTHPSIKETVVNPKPPQLCLSPSHLWARAPHCRTPTAASRLQRRRQQGSRARTCELSDPPTTGAARAPPRRCRIGEGWG